jgi:predicted lipoprotein with Yx(FWY)xxD motif
MKTKKLSYLLIAFTLIAFLGTSCKKYDSNITYPTTVTGVLVNVHPTLGNLITDNNGRSLYFNTRDVAGASTCVDGCAVTWPPFYLATLNIGNGLLTSDFGVITRTDGQKQNTFKGWPLYYYINDNDPYQTTGDAFANLWAIAKPDYSVMVANAQLVGLDGANYNDQGIAATGSSQFLVDGSGRTLYMFSRDTHNTNTFTKADLSNNTVWPIFEVPIQGAIPTILDKSLFITVTSVGKIQAVYKGHPLYYFGQDAGVRGSTKGVSFPTPGAAVWKITNSNTVAL